MFGGSKPFVIAEISSNHNKSLDRCIKLIDEAKAAGSDAVKCQLFQVDQLFHASILERSPKHAARRAWELPLEFIEPIAKHCRKIGILFGCTPFYLDAIAQIRNYVDFWKVASYELLWDELLSRCAATSKPVVVSSGMATLAEVKNAVAVLRNARVSEMALLHCNSAYPTPPRDANLAAIETMRTECDCAIGWSDHSGEPGVIHRAVHRWGATVLELHFDLDGGGAEFEGGHCWLPEKLKQLIEDISIGLGADGDGQKRPSLSDMVDRDWRADPIDGLRPMRFIRDTWVP